MQVGTPVQGDQPVQNSTRISGTCSSQTGSCSQRPPIESPSAHSGSREWGQKPTVSKAAADLMAYCDAHIREDPLIVPVPASENPFREKKFFCTIL
ncbi:hypothetical protein JZ751_024220 [Albula glossodonta]|uniref:Guanine nucleotide-binding protein subunit gamma n=1 Tax=Albula glossodonta TaxID=121402 RepID=A0A8T2NF78_9TELE|nr:hypothetical protein JZ751_024220 [Albula glossodonta]